MLDAYHGLRYDGKVPEELQTQSNPAEPTYLTVNEAAESLGIHQATLRNAIREGRLPSNRIYGKIVVARADMEAYRERTRPTGEKPRGRPPQGTSGGAE